MLKDTAVDSSLIHILSWVGYILELQYCVGKLNGWTGERIVLRDTMGRPVCPLGPEGWDGQVGQRIVLRDTMGCPLMSHMSLGDWGMGWTGETENCAEGHHGMSLDVPYVPWGLRDGMDWWDRGLC